MITIEKGLSNLQNEVVHVVGKISLSEHTEAVRREKEHHNSMKQGLNFIDD